VKLAFCLPYAFCGCCLSIMKCCCCCVEINPEQVYSEAVDVYALAIVMWEFVSRDFAHDGLDR
jgi:hypothetical protein